MNLLELVIEEFLRNDEIMPGPLYATGKFQWVPILHANARYVNPP